MSNGNAVAIRQNASPILDEKKIELLRESIANGAPPMEFELFVNVCNRTGLDPFARQIYFIERGKKWSWQTSIDGYRLIADRTRVYAGSDEPVYTEKDGKPVAASVTVWKLVQGQRCAFTGTARWEEYTQPNSPTWNKMPFLMLAKCAESLALRKAFPAELSGLYTREEMMQAGGDDEAIDAWNHADGQIVVDGDGVIVEDDNTTPKLEMNEIEEEYYQSILAAKSIPELDALGKRIAKGNITHPDVLKAGASRRADLEREEKQPALMGVAAGEAGLDRHSS